MGGDVGSNPIWKRAGIGESGFWSVQGRSLPGQPTRRFYEGSMWSAKVIDDQCWLMSPEGEQVAYFTRDLEVGRVVALLNVNQTSAQGNERLLAFIREQQTAENKLPLDMQKRIARQRLVREGIYREGPDGELILHENYGGPPIEP